MPPYLMIAFAFMAILLTVWGANASRLWDQWSRTRDDDHFVAFWGLVGLFIVAVGAGFAWPAGIPVGIGLAWTHYYRKRAARLEAARREAARKQAEIDREIQVIKRREGWA